MFGGNCTGSYALSLLQGSSHLNQNGVSTIYFMMFNEAIITRARNSAVHEFLKTKATHLMFIDADVVFQARDMMSLLRSDREIICGIYPKKVINWESIKLAVEHGVPANKLSLYSAEMPFELLDTKVNLDEPLEIKAGPTGFMMIRRDVIEKLLPLMSRYQDEIRKDNSKEFEWVYEFFKTGTDSNGKFLSEDYNFCKIVRENNMKVWMAPWVRLAHIGSYTFNGQLIIS